MTLWDCVARFAFSEKMVTLLEIDNTIITHFLFFNEAHFHLSGGQQAKLHLLVHSKLTTLRQ